MRPKAGRVVRHVLKDGTVREYRYAAHAAGPQVPEGDTLQALIRAYCQSPEWDGLAPATRTNYLICLRHLARLGRYAVADVRRRDLLALRDAIAVGRGKGAATGFVRAAAALFAWAVNREWIEHSPAARLPTLVGGHLPAWTPEQAELALHGLPEPLRRVVLLGLHTGQRRGDLIALPWSAYDGSTIRLRQQKTGAALVIPVHPALRAELDRWRADAAATTILTDQNGRPWNPINLSHQLPRALTKIPGMPPGLNVHGLRKLAAANLASAGCTVHEIAAITGHQSLSMVQLYTKAADQERLAGAAIYRLTNRKS